MGSDIRDFYKQGRTCCLVVPLFHAGLRTILCFNFFLALFASCMSFVGPNILALVQPPVFPYIFGVLYAFVCLLHLAGFVCVERNLLHHFRYFKNATMSILGIIFVLAMGVIILSSSKHSVSEAQCMKVYNLKMDSAGASKANTTSTKTGSSSADQAAMTVCDIFSWVQVGVMGFSWMVLAVIQLYFVSKHKLYYELKWEDHVGDEAYK